MEMTGKRPVFVSFGPPFLWDGLMLGVHKALRRRPWSVDSRSSCAYLWGGCVLQNGVATAWSAWSSKTSRTRRRRILVEIWANDLYDNTCLLKSQSAMSRYSRDAGKEKRPSHIPADRSRTNVASQRKIQYPPSSRVTSSSLSSKQENKKTNPPT